jgi:hypothetical protein
MEHTEIDIIEVEIIHSFTVSAKLMLCVTKELFLTVTAPEWNSLLDRNCELRSRVLTVM